MPLDSEMIHARLSAGGNVVRAGAVGVESFGELLEGPLEENYLPMRLTLPPGNDIRLTLIDAKTSHFANGVSIQFKDKRATVGSITPAGYIYSADFSGCVYYLYRNPRGGDRVTGVHAYSGSVNVTKSRLFRSPLVESVVRETSPQDYYLRAGGGILQRIETRGRVQHGGFISCLSCIDATDIVTFVFEVNGTKVVGPVTRHFVNNWRSF